MVRQPAPPVNENPPAVLVRHRGLASLPVPFRRQAASSTTTSAAGGAGGVHSSKRTTRPVASTTAATRKPRQITQSSAQPNDADFRLLLLASSSTLVCEVPPTPIGC